MGGNNSNTSNMGEEEEMGYNPFGYGSDGFGYGPAQTQYSQIQDKVNGMKHAFILFEQKSQERLDEAREHQQKLIN